MMASALEESVDALLREAIVALGFDLIRVRYHGQGRGQCLEIMAERAIKTWRCVWKIVC